jgi:O-antigen ligase
MNFTLSFYKRFWVIEVICLLLIGTVILFPLKRLSMSIALSEIIAIGLFLNMFIYRGLYKHDYKFNELSKKVFWVLFIFGMYFLILFGTRIMMHLSFKDTIWPIRSLVLGSSIFFLMDEYKPKINHLLGGIIFLYSALNIRELIDFTKSSDIRQLSFLDNINIYMYICIMLTTFAVLAIKESKQKRLPAWIEKVAYANMGISMVISFLSGGRLGWVVMIAVVVASFLLVFGFKWYLWKRILSFMIVCSMVTIMAAAVNFMQARSNVYRSFSAIVTRIPSLVEPVPESVDGKKNITTTEASDHIRKVFWEKAWTSIKKNPILGAGTFAVAYREINAEGDAAPRPAHNFILETWMGWGLVGLMLYLAGLFSTCYYIVKKLVNIPKSLRFCCILPIVAAALISFLQSFILLNFQATYIMWFCLGFASVADYYYKNGEIKDI